ncbi:MAG TPA: AAA family ATPase [Candidatus Dormibacteraeota bacterium]
MRVTAFVGRREEVAAVQDALTEARQGMGSVVLVAGEAGIGKTSLAQEVSRTAAWLGTPAVWGPAIEGEGTPPYWVWRQVLTALGRLMRYEQLPDLAQLEAGSSPFVLYEAVVDALNQAARAEGLLVVLDDLHWADPASLRLLQIATAQVPGSRVLILGTYREPAAGDESPLAEVLPALLRERAVRRVRLAGLDVDETESLLAQLLDRPLTSGLARRLQGQTDGSPFYLVELAEEMRKAGVDVRLPHSLRGIARRRLELVGDSCRRTLGAAAVVGRDFDLRLLAAVAGETERALLDALAEATTVGLVEEIGPERHRFAHALLREALYLDLSPTDRAAAHGRVAAVIAGLGATGRRAHIDALAYHLRRALPGADPAEALAATVEAAEAAETELAFEQAAERYAEAVDLAGRSGGGRFSRAGLLLRLARCRQRAGALGPAWEASQAAGAAAREEGDARTLAEAALVVRGVFGATVARPLLTLCREALEAQEGADPVLEARVQAQMSLAAALARPGGGPGLADRALAEARRTGDPEARFLALQAKEWEITGAPELARMRLALSQEAVEVARESADSSVAVWAHSWRLGASWELGLRAQADTELAALADAVDRIKEPLARWRLELALGSLALIDGRYGDAVDAAERALAIARRGGFDPAGMVGLVLRHLAAGRTGDTSGEAELRDELAAGGARLWYASYLAEQGRLAELREVWPGGAGAVPPSPPDMWLIVTAGEARVAAALEDREWAALVYERVAPFSELHVVRGPLGGYDGPLALYCGQLAAVLGRFEEAERFLRQALAAAADIGSPPFEAIARLHLARLLRRRGSPRDLGAALPLLERAQDTAERLGMRPLARMVAADLDQLRHPRGRATPLSNRELEIAALVANGLTNRAIGERLHISERTAENHVKNILDKLGVDSRAQIAAWSAERAAKLST